MKKEPWRIAVFVLSASYIVFLLVKKNALSQLSQLSTFSLPMFATSLGVTVIKVALLAGGYLFVKWLMGKIGGKK